MAINFKIQKIDGSYHDNERKTQTGEEFTERVNTPIEYGIQTGGAGGSGSGESVELQEKEATITTNTTTEITPDEGKALSKVTITTNIPSGTIQFVDELSEILENPQPLTIYEYIEQPNPYILYGTATMKSQRLTGGSDLTNIPYVGVFTIQSASVLAAFEGVTNYDLSRGRYYFYEQPTDKLYYMDLKEVMYEEYDSIEWDSAVEVTKVGDYHFSVRSENVDRMVDFYILRSYNDEEGAITYDGTSVTLRQSTAYGLILTTGEYFYEDYNTSGINPVYLIDADALTASDVLEHVEEISSSGELLARFYNPSTGFFIYQYSTSSSDLDYKWDNDARKFVHMSDTSREYTGELDVTNFENMEVTEDFIFPNNIINASLITKTLSESKTHYYIVEISNGRNSLLELPSSLL